MKPQLMYKYFISFLLTLSSVLVFSQDTKDPLSSTTQTDSIVYKTPYGLRLGIDLSKPIKGSLDDRYQGLEFVADYRINKTWYLAAEFGTEEDIATEDFTNSTSKGSYLRLGANVNVYKNWLDMTNEIFVGFRYGISSFDQTLNTYTINTGSPYFSPTEIASSQTAKGLSAQWTEIQLGLKVEVYTNLYLSASMAYKIMVSLKEPDNFKTLFAPGFNRVFLSNTGFGFNYTLSYTIPFKKK